VLVLPLDPATDARAVAVALVEQAREQGRRAALVDVAGIPGGPASGSRRGAPWPPRSRPRPGVVASAGLADRASAALVEHGGRCCWPRSPTATRALGEWRDSARGSGRRASVVPAPGARSRARSRMADGADATRRGTLAERHPAGRGARARGGAAGDGRAPDVSASVAAAVLSGGGLGRPAAADQRGAPRPPGSVRGRAVTAHPADARRDLADPGLWAAGKDAAALLVNEARAL
jgi:hypothetical protein